MASSESYLNFILDQLTEVEGITSRKMMGEYLLYIHGKIFGGIYDDRFLVKPVPAALARVEAPKWEVPYEGAKEMLLVDRLEDREYLTDLIRQMEPELPGKK